jgi:hypothetical protein
LPSAAPPYLELGDFHLLDARHLIDPADRLGAVPAHQIKPILRLADAAESFGRAARRRTSGPRRAVRRAAQAFLEMKARIEALDRTAHRNAGRRQPRSRTILTASSWSWR